MNLDESSKIFSYGLILLLTHYTMNTGKSTPLLNPQGMYDFVNTTDLGQMVADMQDLVLEMDPPKWEYGFENISVSEMTVELSQFQLSPQIKFDSVTFELPVDMETKQNWVIDQPDLYTTHRSGTDFYTDMETSQSGMSMRSFSLLRLHCMMRFE